MDFKYKNQVVVGIVVLALIAVGLWWRTSATPEADQTAAGTPNAGTPNASGNPQALSGAAAEAVASTPEAKKAQQLSTLTEQYELAERTLCDYRATTKYPHESRPISEQPDQVYPNRPVLDSHPMRKPGGGVNEKVLIKTSQSHVYVVSGESVNVVIKATDTQGKPLPLTISSAVARGLVYKDPASGPKFELPASTSADGTYSTVFTPASSSLAKFNGTIQIEVNYSVDGQQGSVRFDVVYTPEPPATWAGSIREAYEDGGLNFYLKANVIRPGRFIANGRVDDAKGKPFALVTFNDVLKQGPQEIKLTVFGKLLADKSPAFPLILRDVDAYLLLEDADPDRALMPRLMGKAYSTTATPNPKSFSDAEWQSEERSRYLAEFSKDVELAKKALVDFDPAQASKVSSSQTCSSPRP